MEPNFLSQFSAQVSSAGSALGNAAKEQSEFVSSIITSLDVLKNLGISAAIIVGFYIVGKLLSRKINRALQEAQGDSLQQDMADLINRLTVFAALFVGFAIVVQFIFQLDFLQVVGFFSLGISFAFKDLLSNLIAGAVIILQNRFRVNDFIQVGMGANAFKGKIMEIQTRATILKAIDGTEIVVPNAQLMMKPVTSFTAHHSRRVSFSIGIAFGTDIQKAKDIALEVMAAHAKVIKKPKPHVLVSNVAESSVNLSVRFYVDPQDKKSSWIKVKSDLIQQVKEAFDKNGIEIPFPIRTITGKLGAQSGGNAPQ